MLARWIEIEDRGRRYEIGVDGIVSIDVHEINTAPYCCESRVHIVESDDVQYYINLNGHDYRYMPLKDEHAISRLST